MKTAGNLRKGTVLVTRTEFPVARFCAREGWSPLKMNVERQLGIIQECDSWYSLHSVSFLIPYVGI